MKAGRGMCALALAAILSVAATDPAAAKKPAAKPVAPIVKSDPYLPAAALKIEAWLPATPAPDSAANAFDIQTFLATRSASGTPRFDLAVADNVEVRDPRAMESRFEAALGGSLTEANAPAFYSMMRRVQEDVFNMLAPVKKPVEKGGRHRPFVDFPGFQGCAAPEGLSKQGSYPSGHSTFGWLYASILAELAPERADALYKRGIEFGDSRVICGFHYPSDVAGGRIAAAALFSRLQSDPGFKKDIAAACPQVATALNLDAGRCAKP